MPQIPQLQIPQMGAVSGGVDFAPLANLGNIYSKARQDEANKAAIAAFQQTGDTRALLGSGDMSLAKLGAELEQQKAAQAFREKSHADTVNYQNRVLSNQDRTQTRADDAQRRLELQNPYMPDPNVPGGVLPRPGGPQDPAFIASGIKNKATATGEAELADRKIKAEAAGYLPGTPEYKQFIAAGTVPKLTADHPPMDDDTASFLADRVIAGDNRALVGLGRGAQGAENIQKIQALVAQKAKAQGLNAEGLLNNVAAVSGLNSAYRTLGTTGTRFEVAEKAAAESFPLALAASANVPRTQWKALTEFIQKGQTQSNDPNLRRFLIATDTAAKDYARTINPTGVLRESDIEYARKILSTADSPETYSAAIDQLNQEVHIMGRALQRQRDEMKGRGGAVTPPTSTASSTAAAPVVTPRQIGGARPKPTTKEGYDAMPSGTTFIAPDGSERVKP